MKNNTILFCYLVIFTLGFLSCNSRNTTPARIFERKHVSDDQLLIKYSYSAMGKTFIDSATITNKVLKSDTVNVSFSEKNPEENTLQIGK